MSAANGDPLPLATKLLVRQTSHLIISSYLLDLESNPHSGSFISTIRENPGVAQRYAFISAECKMMQGDVLRHRQKAHLHSDQQRRVRIAKAKNSIISMHHLTTDFFR